MYIRRFPLYTGVNYLAKAEEFNPQDNSFEIHEKYLRTTDEEPHGKLLFINTGKPTLQN
jgi:hypothetical protein